MTQKLDKLPRDRLLAEMSLWSADLGRLTDDIARIEPFTDIFHIDVADGHFSPAMLFFPDLVAVTRKATVKPLHVHLMVDDDILFTQVEQFADAGADLISVHLENEPIEEALAEIERRGLAAGLVAQLHTPVAKVAPYLDRIAMFTLLGTRMGVKGQGLDEAAPARLREARRAIGGRKVILAADGGIRENTVPQLRASGAETIVMGSLAFGAPDLRTRMGWVHAQALDG